MSTTKELLETLEWAKTVFITRTDRLKQMDEIAEIVKHAPTIEPPVVHCRDCKHYQRDSIFKSNYCCGRIRKPDDYCSYGAKMEATE